MVTRCSCSAESIPALQIKESVNVELSAMIPMERMFPVFSIICRILSTVKVGMLKAVASSKLLGFNHWNSLSQNGYGLSQNGYGLLLYHIILLYHRIILYYYTFIILYL